MKTNRIIAFIIDIALCSFIVSLFLPLKEHPIGAYDLWGHEILVNWDLSVLTYAAYFLAFDFINQANSPGKSIMKLRVIGSSGQRLQLKTRIGRTLLKLVSILVLPISAIVYLANGKTLHDNLLKSTVISKREALNS